MTSATKSTTPIPRSQNVQQWLRMDHTRRVGNWITVITERRMWTHFDGLMTKLLLKTFYDFLIHHFKKNVKSHVFWNLKKTWKRILEHCHHPVTPGRHTMESSAAAYNVRPTAHASPYHALSVGMTTSAVFLVTGDLDLWPLTLTFELGRDF